MNILQYKIQTKSKYSLLIVLFLGVLFIVPQSIYARNSLEHSLESIESPVLTERALKEAEINTKGGSFVLRVAPGEILPISVELLNFGGNRRVDVSLTYEIFDENGTLTLTEIETVAVETTASFVKEFAIPTNISSGKYTARTSILYSGQVVPATSQFNFTIERKVAGLFLSQFLSYAVVTLAIGILFGLIGRYLIHRIKVSRIKPHDYSDIPKEYRLYFELISDAIMQMRIKVGEDAILMAGTIKELKIDDNGRVLSIEKNPAKIMALLILLYEKNFSNRVNVFPRKNKKKNAYKDPESRQNLEKLNKNIDIVRTYFQ